MAEEQKKPKEGYIFHFAFLDLKKDALGTSAACFVFVLHGIIPFFML